MQEAKEGDTVKVHYKGTLDDGAVFDESTERGPLEFKVGEQKVIPGFEEAVVGMKEGETKVQKVTSDQAYGPRRDEMLLKVARTQLPEDLGEPEVGQPLQVTTQEGQPVPVRIAEVDEENVTLDANHPLAGKDLTFELKLVEISPS